MAEVNPEFSVTSTKVPGAGEFAEAAKESQLPKTKPHNKAIPEYIEREKNLETFLMRWRSTAAMRQSSAWDKAQSKARQRAHGEGLISNKGADRPQGRSGLIRQNEQILDCLKHKRNKIIDCCA